MQETVTAEWQTPATEKKTTAGSIVFSLSELGQKNESCYSIIREIMTLMTRREKKKGDGGRWWCGRGVGAGVVYVRVRVICVGPRVFSGAIGISIPHCGAITPANRLGVLAALFRGGVAEAV